MKSFVHILVLTVLLSACASAPAYTPPQGRPIAKIRFKATEEFNFSQQVRPSGSVVLARADLTDCSAETHGHYKREEVLEVARGLRNLGYSYGQDKEVSPIRMIGTSGLEEADIRERAIEAGKLFAFDIWSTYLGESEVVGYTKFTKKYNCRILGSFVPEPGGEYEIDYANKVGSEGSCNAKIYKLSVGTRGVVLRTTEATQRYYKGLEFCEVR